MDDMRYITTTTVVDDERDNIVLEKSCTFNDRKNERLNSHKKKKKKLEFIICPWSSLSGPPVQFTEV